jgi:N-acetylglucosamine-6-phosphate deacetylase
LGCLDQRGVLEPDHLANITVFDDDVNIFATFVRGQICYSQAGAMMP